MNNNKSQGDSMFSAPTKLTFKVLTAAVVFLLIAGPALAGHYELVKGNGIEVCEAYAKNLNSLFPVEPLLCDRPVSPKFKEFQKPAWERLDFDQNLELIITVDKLLRPNYFAQPEAVVPSLRGNVEQDNYKYQLMIVDIDNDGKNEPVLRFVESCWPGSLRLGGAALVVLHQDKRGVDLKRSRLISNSELTNYSDGMRDVFRYKGKTYFDKWFFKLVNADQLHVMLTESGETKVICKMKFRSE